MFHFSSNTTESILNQIKLFPLITDGENGPGVIDSSEKIFFATDTKTNKVIGYVVLEPKSIHLPPNIHYIEVLETHREKGIGDTLLKKIIRYSIKNGYEELTCLATNGSSEWFAKRGFIGEGWNMRLSL